MRWLLEQGLLMRDALQRLCSKGLWAATVIIGSDHRAADFHAAEVPSGPGSTRTAQLAA